MASTRFAGATLIVAFLAALAISLGAQTAGAVVGTASKAMGAESLTSITYSRTAQNANFGQSRNIGTPWAPTGITRITKYTGRSTLDDRNS